jgi:hypothetical protein
MKLCAGCADLLEQMAEPMRRGSRDISVPGGLRVGLARYFVHRIEPGSFLTAVLSNDLREACACADDENAYLLFDIVFWLYNHAPRLAWGSPARVEDWLRTTVHRPCGLVQG